MFRKYVVTGYRQLFKHKLLVSITVYIWLVYIVCPFECTTMFKNLIRIFANYYIIALPEVNFYHDFLYTIKDLKYMFMIFQQLFIKFVLTVRCTIICAMLIWINFSSVKVTWNRIYFISKFTYLNYDTIILEFDGFKYLVNNKFFWMLCKRKYKIFITKYKITFRYYL